MLRNLRTMPKTTAPSETASIPHTLNWPPLLLERSELNLAL